MKRRRRSALSFPDAPGEEAVTRISDEDGDVTSGSDLCDACGAPREQHLDGKGKCTLTGCKRFVEVA